MSYLRFDIPSAITDNHKIKLNIVVDGDSKLNGGFSIQEYRQTGWEESPIFKHIGITDHSLGATLASLTNPANGTIVWDNRTTLEFDLTDKITFYGEEYSFDISAL